MTPPGEDRTLEAGLLDCALVSLIGHARELLRARRIAEALQCFEQCDFDEAACDVWSCHMLAGDFELAWTTADEIERRSPSRVWNGEAFEGKRVLIRCVHGLGDTIQFIRYARELKRAGAVSVVAQMHPELVESVSTVAGLDAAITWGPRPDFDIEIEVTELPWAFRTNCQDAPRAIPYLSVAEDRIRSRAVRFNEADAFRAGLIWSSSRWDVTRSIPLDLIENRLAGLLLADLPRVSFYSLQHGPDHISGAGRDWLRYSGEQTNDVLDTAADLMNMDLLITPDTMPAHLAGALGRPVWVLLKHDADWRWMTSRCDSPWYPAMRLFRQTRPDDWNAPVEAVAAALADFSRGPYPEASFRSRDLLSLS